MRKAVFQRSPSMPVPTLTFQALMEPFVTVQPIPAMTTHVRNIILQTKTNL